MNKTKFRTKFPVTCCNVQGFFPPIFSHTGYHRQEELAKFGYKSERKLERIKNLTIF
jgi:hypothetical protein